MSIPTYEHDGFFEGTYDRDFQARQDLSPEKLDVHLPYRGRWDLQHAQPVLYDFPDGIEKHLGHLNFPYRQTNQLVQIGLQYRREGADRTAVPDGYMVRYSRLGRLAGADIDKSLIVAVLRASAASELQDTELVNALDADLRWQQIANRGQRFGNAVLAFSLGRKSYKSLLGRASKDQTTPLKPADEELAQATFETVAFWEN